MTERRAMGMVFFHREVDDFPRKKVVSLARLQSERVLVSEMMPNAACKKEM